ncbi:flagellar basal body rod protein FlgC [bacterium]|nr:flagellar basal body rod protein FlgC [bacterium]
MMKQLVVIGIVVGFAGNAMGQGLDSALRYSSSGIMVQRMRLSITAQNIANISTFKDEATGLPYQKQIPIVEATADGVRVKSIEKSNEPFNRYFDPAVPQSDENGYFYYPNVNLPDEMTNLTYTESMYEANVSAFKTGKALYQAAIDALK